MSALLIIGVLVLLAVAFSLGLVAGVTLTGISYQSGWADGYRHAINRAFGGQN